MGLQEKWLTSHAGEDFTQQTIPAQGTRAYLAGDYLFKAGDPSKEMFIVLTGSVAVVREDDDVTETITELGPLEFLGEMGCLQGEYRSLGAVALEDSRVMVIPEGEVDKVIASLPAWFARLLDTLIDRLRKADQHIDGKCRLS